MTRKQERIIAGNNFIYFTARIKKLETEVKSLKDDWLMCDEVCDQKTQENRELMRLARNVVVGKQKLSDLKDYLKNKEKKSYMSLSDLKDYSQENRDYLQKRKLDKEKKS